MRTATANRRQHPDAMYSSRVPLEVQSREGGFVHCGSPPAPIIDDAGHGVGEKRRWLDGRRLRGESSPQSRPVLALSSCPDGHQGCFSDTVSGLTVSTAPDL
jgi:hypothetical protein